MSSVRVAYTGYHEIQTWLLFKFLEKLSTEEEDEREREGGGGWRCRAYNIIEHNYNPKKKNVTNETAMMTTTYDKCFARNRMHFHSVIGHTQFWTHSRQHIYIYTRSTCLLWPISDRESVNGCLFNHQSFVLRGSNILHALNAITTVLFPAFFLQ